MLSIRKILNKTKQQQKSKKRKKKDEATVVELKIEQGLEDAQQTCGCVV